MGKVFINKDNELDGKIIKDLVESHYRNDVTRFKYLYDLYKGEQDIVNTIPEDDNKPNNLLVNNYFGEIVDTIIGYFLGKPVVINAGDGKDNLQDALDEIFDDNDIDDLLMEVGKECSIKGKSAIMVYQNEDSETKIVRVPAEEVIFVYDSSKTSELIYAIRVFEIELFDKDEVIRYAEVYDREKVSYWIEDRSGEYFIKDMEKEDEPHIFNRVPLIEVINNGEKMGDFEKIINLVNDFDKVFSNASNELEAFRNAYLMIKNMTVTNETLNRLKREGVIEVMADGDVKFVVKDVPTQFLKEHLDRLQDNIYRFAQVPNLSDEKFSSNLSGVAIRFKLFGLETKCIGKEVKMSKAIKQLLRLVSEPIKVSIGEGLDMREVDVQFTRNMPNNLVEMSDIVMKLQGIVDKETLLGILPFVDDPKGVIESMEKESNEMNMDFTSEQLSPEDVEEDI